MTTYRKFKNRPVKLEDIYKQPASAISQSEREAYYEKGYLAFPEMFGNEWLQPLRGALTDVIEQTRSLKESTRRIDIESDHSAENPRLRRVAYLDEYAPIFWRLCSESMIPDIAADLLGPNVRFRELMINFKWSGGGAEVKWHQDIAFYPHTNSGTLQFLLMLEGANPEQGPLQVIPESHKGEVFPHYDEQGNWTGAIGDHHLGRVDLDRALSLTGPPGSLSVHHSRTIHGSARNMSSAGRPAFVLTYSAADAIPYTAPAYPSVHYREIVRGEQPMFAHHEEMIVPLPPDWSDGYTSIFDHQEDRSSSCIETG